MPPWPVYNALFLSHWIGRSFMSLAAFALELQRHPQNGAIYQLRILLQLYSPAVTIGILRAPTVP